VSAAQPQADLTAERCRQRHHHRWGRGEYRSSAKRRWSGAAERMRS